MSKRRVFAERVLYFALITTVILSAVMFLQQGVWQSAWQTYSNIYFVLLLAYTWFIFILLWKGDKQQKHYPPDGRLVRADGSPPKITVLVPCYNEPARLLYKALRSVIMAEGDKEILVVDDGSQDNESRRLLLVFAKKYGVKVQFFRSNKGKRHAIHHAVKNMTLDSDFVVTIDSDTVLDRQALTKLLLPFSDPRVGATTGDVQLLNEKQNLLTRMIGTYYWIGLHIYKQAQSNVGMVVCCSGCLAAYRTELLKSVIDRFVNQRFFGEPCTHSEDRHLTNLILERRHHVKYVPEAICYTETPATVRDFLKQQQRWKRGFIRESIYTLTYSWKTRPLLFFEILMWDLTIPFFSFGLMLALVVSVITDPAFLAILIPAWILFMFVRYMPILFYGIRKIPGLILYMFFYEMFLYWQNIYALFTVRNKRWITR
jgi:hyaluronan synthase